MILANQNTEHLASQKFSKISKPHLVTPWVSPEKFESIEVPMAPTLASLLAALRGTSLLVGEATCINLPAKPTLLELD